MSVCQDYDKNSPGSSLDISTCLLPNENDNVPSIATVSNGDQAAVAEYPAEPEILGSVVQSQELENGDKNSSVQLRTSARVSKKMRLDFIANQTPPERKDLPKEEDKLDSKPKRRPFELWPLEDKNTFFEALNEFGKDFDAIQRYFEAKAKRKNLPDHTVKNKEQIRHFYYRTWHKISKHLRFPEEVKKATQELYGLINFGELRKKIGSVSEKTSLKLNELIYRGFTTIRVRGKTIRIKTPICRALRKLNQQEELAEDLKLPARVTVELRPRTNEAWARVQATAQNPRIQTLLPLQRRLSTILVFLEQRWLPHTVKHCERLQSQLNQVTADMSPCNDVPFTRMSADSLIGVHNDEKRYDVCLSMSSLAKNDTGRPRQVLRFAPKADATISPLTINLSEYFTSTRLSLNSHEERLGNHAAEQLFNSMLHSNNKGCGRRGTKRQRHDSSSEKKKEQQPSQSNVDSSPEKSKDGSVTGIFSSTENDDDKPSGPFRLFGSGVSLDASSSSADSGHGELKVNGDGAASSIKNSHNREEIENAFPVGPTNGGPAHENAVANTSQQCSQVTESSEETIKRVRCGWTMENANAVTVGELYLMFGADSKVELEYWWEESQGSSTQDGLFTSSAVADAKLNSCDTASNQAKSSLSSNPLQKLISIVKMYSSQAKCVCGGTPKSSIAKAKVTRPLRGSTENEKHLKTDLAAENLNGAPPSTVTISSPLPSDGLFRRPLMPSPHFKPPPRPGTADAFKAQLEKFRPRGCNRRGRPAVRKNVVVPRMLPLLPKAPPNYQMIPKNNQISGSFLPSGQSSSMLNFPTPTSSSSLLQQQSQPVAEKISDTQLQLTSSSLVGSSVPNSNPSKSDINISMPNLCQEVSSGQTSVLQESDKNKLNNNPQPCHLVQDLFPPTLDTPVNSPPSISNLLDLSLPSDLNLNSNPLLETNFSGLLSGSRSVTPSPASPSTILKEDENQWLNSEDFSLSSFLGHLESPMKSTTMPLQDNNEQTSITSDVETHMQCLMTESSLDYVAKFADLAAQMASDGASKS